MSSRPARGVGVRALAAVVLSRHGGRDVPAIEGARVQMDVEIQARPKALHEGPGASVQLARLAALLRSGLVVARELLTSFAAAPEREPRSASALGFSRACT